MPLLSRLVPRSPKAIVITSVVGLLLLGALWQVLRAWWYHGYSRGTRTGVLRKLSYKGSPLCRYWEGELAVAGSSQTAPEIWTFSVDGPADDNAVVKALQQAEARAAGGRITVSYRQDKGRWWSCVPTEYYVTGIASVEK